jgi:hypothetical protein
MFVGNKLEIFICSIGNRIKPNTIYQCCKDTAPNPAACEIMYFNTVPSDYLPGFLVFIAELQVNNLID